MRPTSFKMTLLKLVRTHPDWTHRQIAEHTGKHEAYIRSALSVLRKHGFTDHRPPKEARPQGAKFRAGPRQLTKINRKKKIALPAQIVPRAAIVSRQTGYLRLM